MIRGGELQVYGIIPADDPILTLLDDDDDVDELRYALQGKEISIHDRIADGMTPLLHVSSGPSDNKVALMPNFV